MILKAEDSFFQGLIDSDTFINSKRRYNNMINKYLGKVLKSEHFDRTFEFQSRVNKAKIFIDLPRKFNEANSVEKIDLLNMILKKKIVLNPVNNCV